MYLQIDVLYLILEILLRKKNVLFSKIYACVLFCNSSAFLGLMIRIYSYFVLFLYTFRKSSQVDFSLNLIDFAVLSFLTLQKQTYKHFCLCSF